MINEVLANGIVKEILKCICYNVSLIDINGKIVASGYNDFVGLINPYVKKVLKTNTFFEIETSHDDISTGILFPIFHNKDIVCILKIDGNVNDIRPFGKLIVALATNLINQDFFIKESISIFLNKDCYLPCFNSDYEKFILIFDYSYDYEMALSNFIEDILNQGNFKVDVASNRAAVLSMA
ncbi:MAG: sugar diacid recognition domain-containing protein [Clostridium sp.]